MLNKGNDKSNEMTEKDKKKAAYALNLCTVSISQIIDYNDLNVLEQEYEMILNNLNLENIPKDEALLRILTQILDTITFFRISEGDKAMIEKKYQNKVKNAIWSAVPNIGVIFAGGNPITIGIGLASQIGMGYMNYRRQKATNELEHEEELWKLQRSAIEQFNALRRELFTTAWRLSDAYNFPDEYRLTEKQISQYNTILMDGNDVRRYQRLKNIEDKFKAYPPFLYWIANTANQIAQSAKDRQDSAGKALYKDYKKISLKYYEEFISFSGENLLRDDLLTAAGCLECIDLLDKNKDRDRCLELLNKAIKFCGNSNEHLQICAFLYLELGCVSEAEKIFISLVNEGYNKVLNAQWLSRIYVGAFIQSISESDNKGRDEVLAKYDLLSNNDIDVRYLFPLPEEGEDPSILNDEFQKAQKYILLVKYLKSLVEFFKKQEVRFIQALPVWKINDLSSVYFRASEEGRQLRHNQARTGFSTANNQSEYSRQLFESEFWRKYSSIFEETAELLNILDFIGVSSNPVHLINTKIEEARPAFEQVYKKLLDGKASIEDYVILEEHDWIWFTKEYIMAIIEAAFYYIKTLPFEYKDNRITVASAETNLRDFCIKSGIEEPEVLLNSNTAVSEPSMLITSSLIGISIEEDKAINELKAKMRDSVERTFNKGLIKHAENKKCNTRVIMTGTPEYSAYFASRKSLRHSYDIERRGIAIIDDLSSGNIDLLLATDGVYPIVKNSFSIRVNYSAVDGKDISKNKLGIKGINKDNIAKNALLGGAIGYVRATNIAMLGGILAPIALLPSIVVGSAAGVVAAGVIKNLVNGDAYTNKFIDMPKLYELILDLKLQSDNYYGRHSMANALTIDYDSILSVYEQKYVESINAPSMLISDHIEQEGDDTSKILFEADNVTQLNYTHIKLTGSIIDKHIKQHQKVIVKDSIGKYNLSAKVYVVNDRYKYGLEADELILEVPGLAKLKPDHSVPISDLKCVYIEE